MSFTGVSVPHADGFFEARPRISIRAIARQRGQNKARNAMMAAFMSPLGTEVEAAKALPRAETAVEVSVVIPCLNEANSIGFCVEKAVRALAGAKLRGEVVVADNGSTDGSVEIAKQR